MSEIGFMWAWIRVFAHETSHKIAAHERGASTVEWAIITAGLAALALAVYAVIKSKVLSKVNEIGV